MTSAAPATQAASATTSPAAAPLSQPPSPPKLTIATASGERDVSAAPPSQPGSPATRAAAIAPAVVAASPAPSPAPSPMSTPTAAANGTNAPTFPAPAKPLDQLMTRVKPLLAQATTELRRYDSTQNRCGACCAICALAIGSYYAAQSSGYNSGYMEGHAAGLQAGRGMCPPPPQCPPPPAYGCTDLNTMMSKLSCAVDCSAEAAAAKASVSCDEPVAAARYAGCQAGWGKGMTGTDKSAACPAPTKPKAE